MNIYLDLNIFDRIEKKENLKEEERKLYSDWEDLILSGKIEVPYSNAHLNDLFRGFQKNPQFIDGHLENIERLTKNLCLCQYWGRNSSTWHFKNIREFFDEKQKEWEFEPTSFDDLFDPEDGIPNIYLPFKYIPLPKNFKLGYRQDPIFGVMYPKCRVEDNMYSLFEDIFNFQTRLKSDYSLYKSLKVYLIRSINKLNNNPQLQKAVRQNFKDLPQHLDIFELSNLYGPKSKTSDNKNFSRLIETFYKFDLKGYKTDGNFNNMFDDSLHTFYGAHCEYFVTNDERCKYKAEQTYKKLNIRTVVIKADEIERVKIAL